MMRNRYPLEGSKFKRWRVLHRAPGQKGGTPYFVCECECGQSKNIRAPALLYGPLPLCVCDDPRSVTRSTHGHSRAKGYGSWREMRNRCLNPSNKAFPLYGGRGIVPCPEWSSFANFWDDMGSTWFPKGTLERKDVNGGYHKENCRWVLQREQPKNLRKNVRLSTPWGELHLSEAARRIGIDSHTLSNRLKRGLVGDDLFAPPRNSGSTGRAKMVDWKGKLIAIKDLAALLDVNPETIYHRMRKGQPLDGPGGE